MYYLNILFQTKNMKKNKECKEELYRLDIGDPNSKGCTITLGEYLRFDCPELENFINKLLLRQIDEDNKRFLGMIDRLELLKRNTPNPLKMDIVHSHGELERMRSNKMFNEAINFVSLELRDKVNKNEN